MVQLGLRTALLLLVSTVLSSRPSVAAKKGNCVSQWLKPQVRALSPTRELNSYDPILKELNKAFILRGGASKTKKSKTSTTSSKKNDSPSSRTATGKRKVGLGDDGKSDKASYYMEAYQKILPVTRVYITLVILSTLTFVLVGEDLGPALLALDPIRFIYGLELWRPLTAATCMGAPSMGWINDGYYLFTCGSSLEGAYGPSQFIVFLICQLVLLTGMSLLFSLPFYQDAMITSMLYVLSRAMPNKKVGWVVVTVPYWLLPYANMATDVLQTKSLSAMIPHIIGILSGHFYHFHKYIWPKTSGEDWLVAPDFLSRRLEPKSYGDGTKEVLTTALKGRKRKKGRKLAS